MQRLTTIIVLLLSVGFMLGETAAQSSQASHAPGPQQRPNYDIKFSQFQVQDTARMQERVHFSGYLVNKGSQRYRGVIQMGVLVADTLLTPVQAASYGQMRPSYRVTVPNVNIPAGDSLYITKNVKADTTVFRVKADHGTLIWPIFFPNGDSTLVDQDTTNNIHLDQVYILPRKTKRFAKMSTDSMVSGVSSQKTGASVVSVYPNPTRGRVQVQIHQPITNGTLEVVNLQGQRLFTKKVERSSPRARSTTVVNLHLNEEAGTTMAPGLYHLIYHTADQKVVKRLVVTP